MNVTLVEFLAPNSKRNLNHMINFVSREWSEEIQQVSLPLGFLRQLCCLDTFKLWLERLAGKFSLVDPGGPLDIALQLANLA